MEGILGIVFQITDDLIGIIGDSKITKKPVGNDIREGKKSLPIILAIKKAKGKNRKTIMRVFGNSKASKQQIRSGSGCNSFIGCRGGSKKHDVEICTTG